MRMLMNLVVQHLTGFRKVLSVLEPNLTSGEKNSKKKGTESKIHLFFTKSLENFRTFLSICETLKNDVFPRNFNFRSPPPYPYWPEFFWDFGRKQKSLDGWELWLLQTGVQANKRKHRFSKQTSCLFAEQILFSKQTVCLLKTVCNHKRLWLQKTAAVFACLLKIV